jgi:hypothetical protein
MRGGAQAGFPRHGSGRRGAKEAAQLAVKARHL